MSPLAVYLKTFEMNSVQIIYDASTTYKVYKLEQQDCSLELVHAHANVSDTWMAFCKKRGTFNKGVLKYEGPHQAASPLLITRKI